MIPCDLCRADNSRHVLNSSGLDGPLVRCLSCGLRYVGERRSRLTFGAESSALVAERVRHANRGFAPIDLDEEQRLARLNAYWRLNIIRQYCDKGRFLEVGCARGEFLNVAKDYFDVQGVEPNPELGHFASRVAPVHIDVVETLPAAGFDVAASFHVIEHVDSPNRFIEAMAQRVRRGGFVVIETPNIESIPFKLLRRHWRQFIPEHYFFFDESTITRLMNQNGLSVLGIFNIGKFASADLILNRLSRYTRVAGVVQALAHLLRIQRLTIRINPRDIMLVVATRD